MANEMKRRDFPRGCRSPSSEGKRVPELRRETFFEWRDKYGNRTTLIQTAATWRGTRRRKRPKKVGETDSVF